MADSTDRNNIPQATVVPKKGMRISVVWIIPLLAAIVAIGIAVQRIRSEGPTITIIFKAAEGVEAGKTFVKYKDVNIGLVKTVQLASDNSRVEVTVKMAKNAAGLMVEDAKFWVVKPLVSMSGVSGLGTLLSGNYIGFEVGKSVKQQRKFTGLETPPIITSGQPGRQFVLKAADLGSLGIGSPVYYRRLNAGQVIAYDLAADGKSVEVKVFVNDPYDQYVNPGTRFWNASGVDVSVGAAGLDVRTQSLVSLLAGGLAFDTPPFAAKAEPVAADTVFTLYSDQATAMKQPDSIAAHYVLYFTDSLRGLSAGAPVTFLGLPLGEVTDVGLDIDPKTLNIRGRVEIVSYPERLLPRLQRGQQAAMGKTLLQSEQQRRALMQKLVEKRGMRAQLRSGSLLTGQLYVALDYFPNAPKVKIDWSSDHVELPVMPSTAQDIEAKLTSIIEKIDKLPFEAIGADLAKSLASLDLALKEADKTLNGINSELTPALKTTLDQLHSTISAAERVLNSTDTTLVGKDAPLHKEVRDVLQEIAGAARSLRILTDFLERYPEALIRGKTGEKP
ncbi:MAG: MlaD family protein [Thermodesulfovibrionales bacterium]|jgi:paraquat-inducible protein B